MDGCHDGKGSENCAMGQVSFADINLDGVLDALVPVCYDGIKCANSSVLTAPVSEFSTNNRPFEPVNVLFGNWRLDMLSDADIYSPLTLRMGDINLDGYPDFLLRLSQPLLPHMEHQTHLFLNVEWQDDDILPKPPKGARGFILRESVLEDIKDTQMATFFDWHEDGVEDVMVIQKQGDSFKVGAFTNATLTSDAYFVKVIVLSGKCSLFPKKPSF